MMVMLAVGVGLGLTLIVSAMTPGGAFGDVEQALASLSGSPANRTSRGGVNDVVRSPWLAPRMKALAPDLKLTETTGEQWFTKAVRSAALAVVGWMVSLSLVGAPLSVIAVGSVPAFVVGVWSEVRWLRVKARERREALVEVAQGLLMMMTVGLHTSKPMSEIAVDVVERIDGWPGRLLRRALWEGNAEQLTAGESMRRFGDEIKSSPVRLFGETVAQGERLHVDPDAVLKRSEQLQVELNQRLVANGGKQQEKIIVPIMVFAVVVMAITMMIPMGAALSQ